MFVDIITNEIDLVGAGRTDAVFIFANVRTF